MGGGGGWWVGVCIPAEFGRYPELLVLAFGAFAVCTALGAIALALMVGGRAAFWVPMAASMKLRTVGAATLM